MPSPLLEKFSPSTIAIRSMALDRAKRNKGEAFDSKGFCLYKTFGKIYRFYSRNSLTILVKSTIKYEKRVKNERIRL